MQSGTHTWSRWLSYTGLGIGVVLLLSALQMYINIQQLVTEGSIRKDGYDFISITKTVTNETMGKPEKNIFSRVEIEELKAQPFITGVAPLIPNRFRVRLSAGDILPFRTDLFIESLDNEFLDTLPPSFSWQEGQEFLPIILSADFFEMYNVFAPGQDLPQISKETAGGIPVFITCEGNGLEQQFTGRIVAFSDRVNSVLVPEAFLTWANSTFSQEQKMEAPRLFIKTKDASDPGLVQFLQSKNYKVNRDKTLLGRNKIIVERILSGLGLFGLLVVLLALMLFSFYLQLVIARSRDNLALLLILGYSPQWLGIRVTRRFLPVYMLIVLLALALTQALQWAFYALVMDRRSELSGLLHWTVFLLALLLVILSLVTNYRLVQKLLYRIGYTAS